MVSRSQPLGFLLTAVTNRCADKVTQEALIGSSLALQVLGVKETLLVSHCPQVIGTKALSVPLWQVWEKEEGGHILGINMLTTRVNAFNMRYRLSLQF